MLQRFGKFKLSLIQLRVVPSKLILVDSVIYRWIGRLCFFSFCGDSGDICTRRWSCSQTFDDFLALGQVSCEFQTARRINDLMSTVFRSTRFVLLCRTKCVEFSRWFPRVSAAPSHFVWHERHKQMEAWRIANDSQRIMVQPSTGLDKEFALRSSWRTWPYEGGAHHQGPQGKDGEKIGALSPSPLLHHVNRRSRRTVLLSKFEIR